MRIVSVDSFQNDGSGASGRVQSAIIPPSTAREAPMM